MIELIMQCDKCGKAKIVRLENHNQKAGNRIGDDLLGFINSQSIRDVRTVHLEHRKWRFFQDNNKLMCGDCCNAYRAHVSGIDARAGEEEVGFFEEES